MPNVAGTGDSRRAQGYCRVGYRQDRFITGWKCINDKQRISCKEEKGIDVFKTVMAGFSGYHNGPEGGAQLCCVRSNNLT